MGAVGGGQSSIAAAEVFTKDARARLLELEDWSAGFDEDEKHETYLRRRSFIMSKCN